MTDLVLRRADFVVTMNDRCEEIPNADVAIADGAIKAVGPALELRAPNEIDMRGHVLIPGLINTHHHFFQTLTRAVPSGQNAELFDWLNVHYPIWGRLRPSDIGLSTKTAMAELMLSGCTTSSDHMYLFPNGSRLDDAIEAAGEMGMRFVATRGAMSVGHSAGGLPPDDLVEDEASILKDCQRVIDRFHDPSPLALMQIALAPCSPFSVSRELMRDAAILAREMGVRLHTHLAENDNDIAYSLERFGCTPAQYAEELGWTGADVWHAHCVKLDEAGIDLFARSGTGVAHCPCSNMRLASGIAPVRRMLDQGVQVALGVDGSASNDAGHLLAEARQAMLLQRVGGNPAALSAREALWLATRGGARVLGRDRLGQIAPGMAADIAAFRMDGIAQAGALHDPVAALVLTASKKVDHLVIAGRTCVEAGQLTMIDEQRLADAHNQAARRLVA